MVRILRDRYLWFLAALAVIMGVLTYATYITTLIGLSPHESWELASYVALYRFLFLLAVAIAAWRFGIKGGLTACFILGQIILSPFMVNPWRPDAWLEIGIIVLGVGISWLIGGYERGRKLLKRTVVELGQQTKELIQEITERQQAEEALRLTEQKYRTIFETAGTAIAIIEEDGTLSVVNTEFERLSGYSKEEIEGKKRGPEFVVKDEQDRTGEYHRLRITNSSAAPRNYEARFIDREGREKDVYITVDMIPETKRSVVSISDITERKRAEELFRSLALSSPIGVYILQDGRFVYANPQFQKDSGYSEEELLSSKGVELVIPEDRDTARENAISMLKGERNMAYEYRVITKRGDIRWALETVASIQHQGRRATLGNFVDITERKRAEEALRQSEASLATAQQIAHVGNWDWDITHNILWWSDETYRIFGLTPQSFGANYEAFINAVHPDDRKFVKRNVFEALYERSSKGIDHRIVRPDGSERFVYEQTEVTLDENGEPIRLVGTLQDITERKRNEERLLEAAEEWRTTFDSITDLVSIVDKDFKLVRVNKAFADTFKMKPVELVGKRCCTMFHGTDEPAPGCPYKATIETKEPATGEFLASHLGVHLEVSTSPIFNETGEVVACVHIARDITERKKMQEHLIVTDRLASVGELASGIAHELNNPLTGVIGFSQLLLDRDVADDVKEDVKVIYREAQRTADVVKNLLTFARKHAPVKELVNINSIVDKVLELRAYEQRINNIQVITQLDPDLPEVIADYFQIQQVFLNIIINAEHFMIESNGRGNLTITTEKVGDVIRASFTDDGPGISKENLGHLFDPFFTTKEVGKGTGLGLSICHGIVTEHSGRIYAESKLGKGATFIVELPITINRQGKVK